MAMAMAMAMAMETLKKPFDVFFIKDLIEIWIMLNPMRRM
jgi:hypothetical protein